MATYTFDVYIMTPSLPEVYTIDASSYIEAVEEFLSNNYHNDCDTPMLVAVQEHHDADHETNIFLVDSDGGWQAAKLEAGASVELDVDDGDEEEDDDYIDDDSYEPFHDDE